MKLRVAALVALLVALLVLAVPTVALADTGAVPPGESLLTLPLWSLVVGAFVPLVTYVLNNKALHISEPLKAFVLVIVTAIAGALTELVDAGGIGFDTATLKYVLAAIIAALGAHHYLWKPGFVNVALGANPDSTRP